MGTCFELGRFPLDQSDSLSEYEFVFSDGQLVAKRNWTCKMYMCEIHATSDGETGKKSSK